MSWQLWVMMALVAAGLVVLATARMRHARKVFDDITDLDRPTQARTATSVDNSTYTADELARVRARHHPAEPRPRRSHG
ncbi:hypothetical protein [Kribbella sp. NPDC048915]|uniref:hypothetical protein n=1 Tax=Kribbella sp. NPDC048915 TaxID=3155148 RepID=UPI0033FDE739